MECIRWSNGRLLIPEEENVHEQIAVNVYNIEEKTGFLLGKLQLTSHRLIWHDEADHQCKLEVSLTQIKTRELCRQARQTYSRILLTLEKSSEFPASSYLMEARQPFAHSNVQFEFEFGGHNEFFAQLNQQLTRKQWIHGKTNAMTSQFHNVGITGIQRQKQEVLNQQNLKIHDSFKDLNVLMNQAKDMVEVSNSIIAKINKSMVTSKAETDDESEDMKNLKSYFLNMGIIDNPVTKESTGSKYYRALALEIYNNMSKAIADNGCIMTLADVYCRLNRARGVAGLISSEDLIYACKELNRLNYELKYNVYTDLNLHVLEIFNSEANKKKMQQIEELIEKNESLTAYGLSQLLNCGLNVAKKHLLDAERNGMLCRDDTNVGLKFYKNLFLIK